MEGINDAQRGPADGKGQGPVHMFLPQNFGMSSLATGAGQAEPSAQRYYLTGARTIDSASGSLVVSRSWHSDAASDPHQSEAIKLYQRAKSLDKSVSADSCNRGEAVGLYHRLKSAALEEARQSQDPTASQGAGHLSAPSKPDVESRDRDQLAQSLAEKLRTAEQRLHLDLRFDTSRDSLNNVIPQPL